METAVLSPLAASTEKTNGDKLSRFSIDGETTVLRKAFDDFYPTTNFASVLNGNYSILNNHLRKRIVNKDQWDKLFSPDGVESDFHKFNITLLFLLLINICSSSDPLSGWHDKAPPHDVCFEANRNVLFCNMTSTSVDGQTFPLLWQEVSSTLHALGLDQAEIDRLRTEHGGEQDYIDALIEWDDSEKKIKTQLKDIHQTQLELRKALQDSNSKLEELLSNAQRKTQDVADEAVKMEPKGQQEMTAAHQKSMSCLEGLSHQEMTAGHQKNMSLLEGLVIKSQSKTQQEIHEIRESVQQIKHEVKTLKKRTNEQTDETSPVEFFGVPLNDQELLDADPRYVLGACKRFISPGTYDEHFTHLTSGYRTPKQVLRSLLKVLAGLDSKDQDECLEAILHALREASEVGFSHVIERLQKGRQMVNLPLTENLEVIYKVSARVGSSWKSLARDLELEDVIINSLAGEEREDIERCYRILRRWCEYNGRNATVRKLMIALTKMGKAEVNNDIMRCLNLVKPYVVDTSVTNAIQTKMLRSKL